MKYNHIYNYCGKNYKKRSEAENRMMRIQQDHKDTEFERILAGRGPFTTKTTWEVKGNEECGFYVLETIEK